MAKLLWNLCGKKDNLWIKWVHTYYFKGEDLLNVQLSQNVSWIIKAIMKQIDTMHCMTEWNLMQTKFETRRVYKHIKKEFPKVTWRYLFHKTLTRPRALIVFWLTCHYRLTRKECIKRFGLLADDKCNFYP